MICLDASKRARSSNHPNGQRPAACSPIHTSGHWTTRSGKIINFGKLESLDTNFLTFIQVASAADGSNLQHVQVLPVQNTAGAAGQPIMLQSQVIQTADGQTLIYQPVQVSLCLI